MLAARHTAHGRTAALSGKVGAASCQHSLKPSQPPSKLQLLVHLDPRPPLAARPHRPGEQHGCARREELIGQRSSDSADSHRETPAVGHSCGRACPTNGTVKVHERTHGAPRPWEEAGRREHHGKEGPRDVSPGDRGPFSDEDAVVWNQDTTMLSGGLTMRTPEISVIQSEALPLSRCPWGPAPSSETGGSRPAISANVEQLPTHQFPHSLGENKIVIAKEKCSDRSQTGPLLLFF